MKLSSERIWFVLKSNKPKKNVLFLMIGPPKLTVPCCVFVQFGSRARSAFPCAASARVASSANVGTVWLRLLDHVFGSNAVFRKLHTALPLNLLVPERVVY